MVEMTETARILNTATRAEPRDPRRDRPRHEHLRRHLARLGDRRVPARRDRLPHALRDALPRTDRTRANAAERAQPTTSPCDEWEDHVVFLHKIVPGAADKSYGIHVARLAGVPAEVNERAKQILARLEQEHLGENGRPKLAVKGKRSSKATCNSRSSPPPSIPSCTNSANSTSTASRRSKPSNTSPSFKQRLPRRKQRRRRGDSCLARAGIDAQINSPRLRRPW